MSIIYTNTVPLALVYPNFHHLLLASETKPSKLYVNFWDNYALEHFISDKLYGQNKSKEITRNISVFEKLISSTKIPFRSFIYTEANKRFLRDKEYYDIFVQILSSITMNDLEDGHKINELIYGEMTLSNIFNIIIDYLIATFLDNLYPEFNLEKPDIYFTSSRFKLFYPAIEKVLKKEYSLIKLPQPVYAEQFPFIRCPKSKIIPGLYSDINEIQFILTNYFENNFNTQVFIGITDIIGRILLKFKFKNELIDKSQFLKKLKISDRNTIIELLSQNFLEYFLQIEKLLNNTESKKKDLVLINNLKTEIKITNLNHKKLNILKLCNGDNTSLHISKALNMNLSTVSAYLGQLKRNNLVTDERKPKRMYDRILINLTD